MADAVAVCLIHGPMQYRPGPGWWECAGFDGEGHGVMLTYDEDVARGFSPDPVVVIRRRA